MKRVPSFSQQSFPIPVHLTSCSRLCSCTKRATHSCESTCETQESCSLSRKRSRLYLRSPIVETNFSSEFGQEQQHVLICKLKALTKALWIGDVAMTPLLFLAKLPQKLTADFRCSLLILTTVQNYDYKVWEYFNFNLFGRGKWKWKPHIHVNIQFNGNV